MGGGGGQGGGGGGVEFRRRGRSEGAGDWGSFPALIRFRPLRAPVPSLKGLYSRVLSFLGIAMPGSHMPPLRGWMPSALKLRSYPSGRSCPISLFMPISVSDCKTLPLLVSASKLPVLNAKKMLYGSPALANGILAATYIAIAT